MCWFQGEDHPSIPKLNKKCIGLWRDLNPDWQVNVLSNETIADYVPEYIDIIKSSPERTYQAKSDLLRLLLLSKYGGVWVDATVYPTQPLSEFYDAIVNKTGFFAYRFIPRGSYNPRESFELPSWFLCTDGPEHYLIEKWKAEFIHRYKTLDAWPYFTIHRCITDLYDKDEKIEYIINNMIQISETIPHSACIALNYKWKDREESYVYKKPNLIQND